MVVKAGEIMEKDPALAEACWTGKITLDEALEKIHGDGDTAQATEAVSVEATPAITTETTVETQKPWISVTRAKKYRVALENAQRAMPTQAYGPNEHEFWAILLETRRYLSSAIRMLDVRLAEKPAENQGGLDHGKLS